MRRALPLAASTALAAAVSFGYWIGLFFAIDGLLSRRLPADAGGPDHVLGGTLAVAVGVPLFALLIRLWRTGERQLTGDRTDGRVVSTPRASEQASR